MKLIFSILIFVLTIPSQVFCQSGNKSQPNIILILADDLGYGDLSCYGSDIPTPNIDRLAEQGVKFMNFYSNGGECTPTRAALLTGRYQQRIGGMECAIGLNGVGRYQEAALINNSHDLGLPVELNAIPSILKKVGYNTALVGKWHLGYEPKFRPSAQGFDYSIGPLGGGVDYFQHSIPTGVFIGHEVHGKHDFYMNGQEVLMDKGYYTTYLLTDYAVNWINNQQKDIPFFLYLPYTAPHKPHQGPNDYLPRPVTVQEENTSNREAYIEMVKALDRGVGKILKKVQEEGIADNTVIIFVSDNGPASSSSTPFRNNKGTLYGGGIRVPCIIQWPGHIKPGTVSHQVGITMDLTASIARIAGASAPHELPFDGVDIIEDIETNKPVYPRILFWRKKRADKVFKAVRDGDMKYLYLKADNGKITEGLYNLKADPQEKNNLINKYPDEAEKLKKLLTNWEDEVSPNYWGKKLNLKD